MALAHNILSQDYATSCVSLDLSACKSFKSSLSENWEALFSTQSLKIVYIYRVAQKTGPPYLIANILKTPSPNCLEIGELLQYYMLYTVINFLFKNFIALWRHLAKTQLLCDAQIYLYSVNKRQ